MRYLLLMHYAAPRLNPDCTLMSEWAPDEVNAHIDFMFELNRDLLERGELVGAEGLAGPEAAKTVSYRGTGTPLITDGPYPESKEVLAGYWMIDVETEQRALEIAAYASTAPGPGGEPIGTDIEVRQVMGAPVPEV